LCGWTSRSDPRASFDYDPTIKENLKTEVYSQLMLPYILTGVICFVVAAVLFFVVGVQYRKKVAEKEISSAEEEAKRIINESIKSAESKKREALVEAKEEILQARNEYEREVKERRADL